MLGRLIKDESGIAMGLAVIVVLLVGVMGAGLLVFVRNDLEAVVEVNRGQKAFDIADAGVQAAKRQLLSDVNRQHYDVTNDNDCDSANRVTGEDWSPATEVYTDPTDCDSSEKTRSVPGVTENFAGGEFNVVIQCFDQTGASPECKGIEEDAPESVEASKKSYFKVTSTGYYPEDGTGAKRKIEAIFNTQDLGVPQAFYTPGDIKVTGGSCIKNVSLFARGNISVPNNGGCRDDDGNKDYIEGEDFAYGDWENLPFNNRERPVNKAGAGTAGEIDRSYAKKGTRDFDKNTDPIEFIEKDSPRNSDQDSDEITFPFDYTTQKGQQDKDRMAFLKEEAKRQNNYYSISRGGKDVAEGVNDIQWPSASDSSQNTVVFVEYTQDRNNNEVTWDLGNDCNATPVEGTLVIQGGDFKAGQNTTPLKGAAIVRNGGFDRVDGEYTAAGGNICLDGFVNASGGIEIKGSPQPFVSEPGVGRPGFYGVQQWSWRECYSEDCN